MSHLLNHKPLLVQIPGKESGDMWMLSGYYDDDSNRCMTGGWTYTFKVDGNYYRMRIPARFAADGASVPRFVDSIIKMGARSIPDEAWLAHDFIYHHKGRMPAGTLYRIETGSGRGEMVRFVDREFADRMFRNELEKDIHGLSEYKAPLAYAGVRGAFWKDW